MCGPPGGKGTPYDGLYRDAPPERGTFFRLLGYKVLSKVSERGTFFVKIGI